MSHVLRMIAEGEHQQQDFKTRIDDSRKIARTLVAFANADGGRLLVGVKDNGTVSGVRVDEELHMVKRQRSPIASRRLSSGAKSEGRRAQR